ncbi:MAG: L-threonylcarbamoyladenylate synthase [Brachymonas sp.]|nr:L-threonylcarbamoyladenylate synthase [Brachymonas sp.]
MLLDASSPAAIEQAADILASGGLLGLPTETVYGLAARADNDEAVNAIFTTKGRPKGHPLIVHVLDAAAAEAFVAEGFLQQLPDHAAALMRAFWPGPLTVIVPRRADVADAAAGQHATIGLRSPAHPAAQAVLKALLARGVPGLAAPSANRFGSVSPTTAQHVTQEFGEAVPVLDAGACPVGIESTIIDCTRGTPVLLRPGVITPEAIWQKLQVRVQYPQTATDNAPQAPGTLAAHYAPRAKLRLMGAKDMQAALDLLGKDAPAIGIWSRTPVRSKASKVRLAAMPDNAAEAARELFARLRAFDEQGVTLIWVEPVPTSPEWEAVADRLQRAAAG